MKPDWKSHQFDFWLHVILARIYAPFLVAFFSTPDKRFLTRGKWVETIDNDLSGDDGWKNEHLWGRNPLSYWNRVRWIWRNGGNRYNYEVLGCPDMPEWREHQDHNQTRWERPDGYWLERSYTPLPFVRMLEQYYGWQILGPQKGLCKYVFTVRIKTKP